MVKTGFIWNLLKKIALITHFLFTNLYWELKNYLLIHLFVPFYSGIL